MGGIYAAVRAAAARSQFADLDKARVEGVRTSAAGPAGRPRALPRSAPPYCADRTLPEFDLVLLWRMVENADIRVLLMMRFNPSGDLKWLGPNYRPQRDVRLIADEDAALSPRVRAQIREIRGQRSISAAQNRQDRTRWECGLADR